ncbi:hypothetical protein [Desulfobacter latus]|uniref:Uncharacterized protein n=1 Tax=Desulfobacter latus TaxID=2292 RepID=A0A850SYZ3_9BACT|nr:hypothetical protein [Desulfobacter latus]NWH06524.1 hypothetical protein [Desulfobacter latus]
MDFGDFITLVLFLIFVVSPFLKRKKTQKPGKSKQSGFSILGKIREALQEAAREMEAQVEQARKKEASGQRRPSREFNERPLDQAGNASVNQTFWDEIDDRKDVGFYSDDADAQVLEPITSVNEEPLFVSTKKEIHRKATKRTEKRESKSLPLNSFGHNAMQAGYPRSSPRHLPARDRARGLQRAVIWSEILAKPVALKDQ